MLPFLYTSIPGQQKKLHPFQDTNFIKNGLYFKDWRSTE